MSIADLLVPNPYELFTDSLVANTVIATTIIGSAEASALKTTGSPVNVSLASPPVVNQVLRATSATTATWQALSTSGNNYTAQIPIAAIDSDGVVINNGTSTITLEYADASFPGIVSTSTQTFAGAKTFTSAISAPNITGTNTGDITLTAVGAAPNATAASLTGQTLTLQPADTTNPGVVTTGAQSFAGAKTFTGAISASNLSGTNTGNITLAAVGAAPNANAASLSGQALTLQPADATNPGVVTTGTQTFAGAKTFTSAISAPNVSGSSSGTNTGDVTLAAFGSTANASGASISGQVLTLQPASASFPGGVTTGTQSFAGAKTFNSDIGCPSRLVLNGVSGGSTDTYIGNEAGATIFNAPTTVDQVFFGGTGVGTRNELLRVAGSGAVTLAGSLYLQGTTSSTVGVIYKNGSRFLHGTGGNSNFFGGTNAGNFTTTTGQSTGIGENSLGSITNGNFNTFMGFNTAPVLTTGGWNCGYGVNSMISITTGNHNTAIGLASLLNLTTGNSNVCAGENAGGSYTSSESNNVCVANAGTTGESGIIRIGTSGTHIATYIAGAIQSPTIAGVATVTGKLDIPATTSTVGAITQVGSRIIHTYGTNSTFVGTNSGNFTLTGYQNSGMGVSTLSSLTSGIMNTGIGFASGGLITSGNSNTGVGCTSMAAITSGSQNTAMGMQALMSLTTGTTNSVYGFNAGQSYTSSESNNICIGYSVTGTLGESNVIRLGNTSNTLTVLQGNVDFPVTTSAVGSITQGGTRFIHSYGVASFYGGPGAGNFTSTGSQNVGIGAGALSSGTTASNTVLVGFACGSSITTGINNTVMGSTALNLCTTGGFNALFGVLSGSAITTGNENTAVGTETLINLSTGNYNTCLGKSAGAALTGSDTNNICIGYNQQGVAGDNHTTRLGYSQTRCYIAGVTGATGTAATISPAYVGSDGQLCTAGTNTSVSTLVNCTGARTISNAATLKYFKSGNYVSFNLAPESALLTTTNATATAYFVFTNIFPVGFRPAVTETYYVGCTVNATYNSQCQATISSAGTVSVAADQNGTQFISGQGAAMNVQLRGGFFIV